MLGAGSRVLAGGGELVRAGAPLVLPPAVVAVAEHRRALRRTAAVADPAGWRRPRQRRRVRCTPAGQVRASCRAPLAVVPLAQAAGLLPVIASCDGARAQRQVPVPVGVSRRGELRDGQQPAGSATVASARCTGPARGAGGRSRSPRTAARRRPGRAVEDQVIGPELRAHRGHELLQQASGSPVLPVRVAPGFTGRPRRRRRRSR